MENKDYKWRVIKGNWRTNEVLFMSDVYSDFGEALIAEKPLVKSLSPRGSGDCVLVKVVEDRGPDYPYMDCGGWMIFTHRETLPGEIGQR